MLIRSYIEALYELSAEMAPYLLLGFLFAGILHVYIRKDRITRYMGTGSLKSVLYASLLGVPMPLCSCGVIPAGMAFHKDGASKPATVSFLISTPQTGVDSVMVTWSLLGWPLAIIRPVAALITGIAGGMLTRLKKTEIIESLKTKRKTVSSNNPAWIRMFRYAFVEFMDDIAKWLLIGLLLAAFMAVLIPDDFFTQNLDSPLLSMVIVLLASVPLYVCATGSVPIAAVLMMKGLSPGAALVLLMAGPATNIATMTVIGKKLGRWALTAYLFSIITGALVFGILTDLLLSDSIVKGMMDHDAHGQHHSIIPDWINVISLILLTFFILLAILRKSGFMRKKNDISDDMRNVIKIKVSGMTCSHCKSSVEEIIGNTSGVKAVEADQVSGTVVIEADNIDIEAIRKQLADSGYTYKGEVSE